VLYIYKNRSSAQTWGVCYTIVDGSLDFMFLNLTNSAGNASQSLPTSTVLSMQASANDVINGNNYVAYCFAPVSGYSSFGSYTGNGSADGPFVYTGFRPRWVMIKRTDTAGFSWFMLDTARDTYNLASNYLNPNAASAETAVNMLDIVSSGFKLRSTSASFNASAGTYIYAAVAESPFAYSRAR
jgi:hypothetical protein